MWLLGVTLAIGGGVVNAIGVIIQKRAHAAIHALPEEARSAYVCYPWWVFGFVVYVSGNLANSVALTWTTQSIISPLQTVNLVANAVLAPIFLGEKIGRADIFAIICILIGCALTVLFGSQSNPGMLCDDAWVVFA
jgi:drug/metabolite transporter (DMT)-like permease